MKTVVQLEERLVRDAESFAAETGQSLSSVIEDALQSALSRRRQSAPKQRVKLKTHGSGGLQPGVDLNNSAELLDLLESPNGAS